MSNDKTVTIPLELAEFLLGQSPLPYELIPEVPDPETPIAGGVWFNTKINNKLYWWRPLLRKMIDDSTAPAPGESLQEQKRRLAKASTEQILEELSVRGGHPGALADAALLCIRKSRDYNHGKDTDPHNVDRSDYFPFGAVSYAQMLHTKSTRFVSLTQKNMDGKAAEYEGLRDTAFDIINYAGFYLADEDASE